MKSFFKKPLIVSMVFFAFFIPVFAFGQPVSAGFSTLTVSFKPRYELPLFASADRFDNSLSGQFSLAYKPPIVFPLYVSLDLGYTYLPFKLTWANPLHTTTAGGGVGLNFRFLGRLAGDLYVKGGYYETVTKDLNNKILYGGNPYLDAGAGLSFYLSSRLRIGVGTSYRHFFGLPDDLFKGVGFYIGTSFRFPLSGSIDIEPVKTLPARLDITKVEMDEIFPVFYKYYDEHPIGKVTVKNKEKGNIDNITVSFFIKQYMDNPKTYSVKDTIKRGESRTFDVFALFNERVLDITEGAKVSSELQVKYDFKGDNKEKSVIKTISLQNRNASIWDDDRRAAAFITARDPVVLKLSKNLAGIIREEPNKVFGKNFMSINAIHNALSVYGITYVVDPKTPYKDFHKNKQAVDFLQFPRQTLEYKAGDCDDLSILYSALLEALSIDTALITVPGHIYIAVDLGITPKEAKAVFYNSGNLIIRNSRVWLPFEVTMVQDNFSDAWTEGAREWHKYNPAGKAGFYPVSDAWKVFEPVGLPGDASGIIIPPQEKIKPRFVESMQSIIKKEVQNKAEDLKTRITKSGSYKLVNRLGILYARYGLYEDAEKEFKKILGKSNYRDIGYINIGNIRYKKGDFKGALNYYNRAKENLSDNSKLLINIARANYKLKDYDKAQKFYEEVKIISPEIAEKFQYLGTRSDTTERAASAEEKGNVLWEE